MRADAVEPAASEHGARGAVDRQAPVALELRGVQRRYGSTVAVDDVSLTLRDDEVMALVGPSGSGKSTLLRIVAGLVRPDAGTVELGGRTIDDGTVHVAPEERRVGLVFQDHALFPHLTVAGNVGFGLARQGRAERAARVSELLELVGLGALRDRYPHELSGGERQRVALVRALAPRPVLLLLDEPFASLDPNLRAQVRLEVLEALRRERTPALLVTHDQEDALASGDRVAVLRQGRLEQVGTAEEVYLHPANRFVAGFMGEASLLRVVPQGSTLTSVLGAVPLPAGRAVDAVDAHAVAMARPDDVALRADASGSATVVGAEFRGASWLYTVEVGAGERVLAATSHLQRLAIGDRVDVTLAPGHELVLLEE